MNYREVKRRVRVIAAGHLDSLEVYDEFPEEDEDRVSRAIRELQAEIRRARAGKTIAPALGRKRNQRRE